MKWSKGLWTLFIFNALYLAAFILYYLSIANYEFLIYIAVVVVLGLVIIFTVKYSKLDLFALWGLTIWGLLHMLGGSLRVGEDVLYRYRIIDIIDKGGDFYILKMDQFIHFYGFLVTAIVVYQLLQQHMSSLKNPKLIIFIAWIGAMGLGALNEVVEFVAFVALAETGVGDVYNTGLDLIFNMLGALTGAFIQHIRVRRKS